MTDRELLEAAATVALRSGLELKSDAWACGPSGKAPEFFVGNTGPAWDPLKNDGDALRFALLLRMRVDYVGDQPCVDGVLQSGRTAEESLRRAVVRAATSRDLTPNV